MIYVNPLKKNQHYPFKEIFPPELSTNPKHHLGITSNLQNIMLTI